MVTCTANYFNKAAHENGKRKLTGYITLLRREKRTGLMSGRVLSAHMLRWNFMRIVKSSILWWER